MDINANSIYTHDISNAESLELNARALSSSYLYWIELYMGKRGITNAELAKRMGTTERAVKALLANEITPSFTTIAKMEEVLKIRFIAPEPKDYS